MTYNTPIWLDNGSSYSADADRHLIGAVFEESGVLGSTELKVSQRGAGANQSVDVALGRALIPQQSDATGKYLCRLTGSVQNIALNSPPGSNSRYDVIYAEVRDATISGSDNDWRITFVEGTAAASPSVPALPHDHCIALARVLRASGDSTVNDAEITDMRNLAYLSSWRRKYNERTAVTASINSTTTVAICTVALTPGTYVIDGAIRVAGSGVASSPGFVLEGSGGLVTSAWRWSAFMSLTGLGNNDNGTTVPGTVRTIDSLGTQTNGVTIPFYGTVTVVTAGNLIVALNRSAGSGSFTAGHSILNATRVA